MSIRTGRFGIWAVAILSLDVAHIEDAGNQHESGGCDDDAEMPGDAASAMGTTQTVTIGDGKVGEDWDADEDPAGSALGQTGTEDDVIVAAAVAVTDNVAVVMEDVAGYVAAEGVLMHYVIGILHWHRH